MKILEIELKNLNSLKGQWRINLTGNIYELNGIFLITGPTGAGKTTIFDAVCLALYGQTPRLKIFSDKQNEIMSRKTSECFAKVLFEAKGKKYISIWEQHKSSKNNLQPPKHFISDAETGEIISSKIKDTQKKVEEITGLDFQRFRQAVMLEQGGFDAFLNAKKNERAQILELLTGTEIYGKISTLVYERAGEEKLKLENIKFQLETINLNDENQDENEIINEINENQKNLSLIEAEQDEIKKALEWLKNIFKIENDIEENSRGFNQLYKRYEIFTPENKRLESALRASEISSDFSALRAKRDFYRKILERIETIKRNIINENENLFSIENNEIPELESRLKELIKNIPENETPEIFCTRVKERVKIFNEIAIRKNNLEKEINKTGKNLKQAQTFLKSAEENLTSCQQKYDDAAKKFDDLVNMRAEAILENERRKLQPGIPCPLCGSVEHPFINYFEDRNSYDALKFDDALKFSRIQRDKAKNEFENASKNFVMLQANYSELRIKFDNLNEDLSQISTQRGDLKEEINNFLLQMGIIVKSIGEIIPSIDTWLKNIHEIQEKITISKKRAEFFKTQIEIHKKNLENETSEFENLKNEIQTLEENFTKKIHEKNFDSEKSFEEALISPEELKKLQERKKELDGEFNKLNGIKENLAKKLEIEKTKSKTSKTLEILEPEFRENEKIIKNLSEKIFMLKRKLEELKEKKSKLQELEKQYKTQQEIYFNWSALNVLIGSAKGDKFRVFAQNVTLEIIISLANLQLEKMNGRYILISRPGSDELDLSVIDKEQAGEIRPTDNLSGGEKFIISLALALGLSQISGNKSQIDSLFLDEGFGSLDEDSLNTALDALGEIRRNGKIIGIISHVQALRERIAAQINIIPKREGVSIIEGAGVFSSRS